MEGTNQLLVLANSLKQGGLCLAGRFIKNEGGNWNVGGWCRPVLPDGNGHDAMPRQVCEQFKPLDVVSITLEKPVPENGQPENWLWAADTPIRQEHTFNGVQDSLRKIVEEPEDLWLDPTSSRPDEVGEAHEVGASLYLVQPRNLELSLRVDLGTGRKHIHAAFQYRNHHYESIPVTDPLIFRILSRQFSDDGVVTMPLRNGDRYWLAMSIGLPFGLRRCRYKFVAAVIDHSGYLQRTYR